MGVAKVRGSVPETHGLSEPTPRWRRRPMVSTELDPTGPWVHIDLSDETRGSDDGFMILSIARDERRDLALIGELRPLVHSHCRRQQGSQSGQVKVEN